MSRPLLAQCGVVRFEPDDLQPAFGLQADRITGEVASSASEEVAFPLVVLGGEASDACPSADNAVGGGGRGRVGTDQFAQAVSPSPSGVEAIWDSETEGTLNTEHGRSVQSGLKMVV